MRGRLAALVAALAVCVASPASAKVDLVTLPARERVQITIYNTADLTLARDVRTLTLREGLNRLQFSWANTLIDPTSLELLPQQRAREIAVQDLEYPPRVTGLGIWNVASERAGEVPVEITYFTSGIHWNAYYLAMLSPDEETMRLEGYVRVTNGSGEDYENAETRLVVGQVNLLDEIAQLARRQWPHGRPGQPVGRPEEGAVAAPAPTAHFMDMRAAKMVMAEAPKEIRKEGLSEYFLYTIEGTEDIPNGWGKRLISFTAGSVPVRNLYRYEEERYGTRPVRFLRFTNDREHRLGKEPIPGGLVKVFRRLDDSGQASYVGAQHTKYVPKGEEVNLQLGPTEELAVEPVVMEIRTDNYEWLDDAIQGWDEHITVKVAVANYRSVPAQVEVRRNFPVASWEIETRGGYGQFEKVDKDTVQYTLDLPPGGESEFSYTVVLHHGSRAH